MVNWQCWTFRFLDTCFFRNAFPYHAGEGGYTAAQSLFPPHMSTIQGAIRTSLAYEQGWRPTHDDLWPGALGRIDNPGSLQLRGPYLLVNTEPVFSVPSLLLVKALPGGGIERFCRLTPGEEVESDLGRKRFPRPVKSVLGAKPPHDRFITKTGLRVLLEGGLPDTEEIKYSGDLYHNEPRIGLERVFETRTAKEGMLYKSIHVRPANGVNIAVLVSGIPAEWKTARRRIVSLGGEGRMVEIIVGDSVEPGSFFPPYTGLETDSDGKLRFTVTLVTTGWYDDPQRVILEGPPGIPGQCVSACVGRLERVGGWDLANQRPRPLLPLLPAGSTWFFETDADQNQAVAAMHGECPGARPAYGYGQILIGKWGETN